MSNHVYIISLSCGGSKVFIASNKNNDDFHCVYRMQWEKCVYLMNSAQVGGCDGLSYGQSLAKKTFEVVPISSPWNNSDYGRMKPHSLYFRVKKCALIRVHITPLQKYGVFGCAWGMRDVYRVLFTMYSRYASGWYLLLMLW